MKEDSFLEFVREQLSPVDRLRVRRMFGAHGLYAGETFFGIVCRGQLFLKTDDESVCAYQRRGMKPFKPNARQTIKTYYEVPADVLDDRLRLNEWAARSIAAGRP